MDFDKLTWYIFPYNMGDVRIVGADPSDARREQDDDRYWHEARVYAGIFELSKRNGIAGPFIDDKGWYEYYLDPYKFHGYTLKEIQPIAIEILFYWFSHDKSWQPRDTGHKVRG